MKTDRVYVINEFSSTKPLVERNVVRSTGWSSWLDTDYYTTWSDFNLAIFATFIRHLGLSAFCNLKPGKQFQFGMKFSFMVREWFYLFLFQGVVSYEELGEVGRTPSTVYP